MAGGNGCDLVLLAPSRPEAVLRAARAPAEFTFESVSSMEAHV
jgi:hypothetical protein